MKTIRRRRKMIKEEHSNIKLYYEKTVETKLNTFITNKSNKNNKKKR